MHSRGRLEYEFDLETKRAAFELYLGQCAECGGAETRDDPFEYDHELPIWYAKEIGGALSIVVIKSLANCRPVHRSCHKEKHRKENRTELKDRAIEVFRRYLDQVNEPSRDDWRQKLRQSTVGRNYEQRTFSGHD